MKTRLVVFLIILAAALLLCASVVQSPGSALAGAAGGALHIQAGPGAAGGAYRLSGETLPGGAISGGGYILFTPRQVQGTGLMCCCAYLPCVARNLH